jgi:hypothetical protein
MEDLRNSNEEKRLLSDMKTLFDAAKIFQSELGSLLDFNDKKRAPNPDILAEYLETAMASLKI